MNILTKISGLWLAGLALSGGLPLVAMAEPPVTAVPTAQGAAATPTADQPIDQNQVDRTILVTFQDRSIERTSVVGGDRYRSRGAYDSTLWGRRVADYIAEKYTLEIVAQWPISELDIHCVVFKVPEGAQVDVMLARLRDNHRIETAQPMHTFRTMTHNYNDPYYELQRSIRLMQVEAAHRFSTGKQIRIAIIDTGIDQQHPDLKGQVVINKDYSAALPSSTAGKKQTYSYDAHGTAVAGVIGAVVDNGIGIVGVAPGAKLISMKACNAVEERSMAAVCNSLTLAQALNQAIRIRPDIINMSLAGPVDPLLQRLIDRALDAGIVVVAAASPLASGQPAFPASMERVISVSDQPGDYHTARTLLAPGADVLSTVPYGTYDYVSGSSISAATVSGLAALILQLRPGTSSHEISSMLAQATIQDPKDASLVINACHMMAQLQSEALGRSNTTDTALSCTTLAAR